MRTPWKPDNPNPSKNQKQKKEVNYFSFFEERRGFWLEFVREQKI